MSLASCPDCGRVISLTFPMHGCEPTASWRKANPGVFWVVKFRGNYLGKPRGRAIAVTKQREATRFDGFDKAAKAREDFGGRVVRVSPKKKAKAR